jgi:hypothetical protein
MTKRTLGKHPAFFLIALFLVWLSFASYAAAVPTADDASFQVPAGGSVNGDLSLLVSDFTNPDFNIIQPPAHGSVALQTLSGAFTYTPSGGYTGPDSFRYGADEAPFGSPLDTGIISLTVCPAGTCTAGPVPTVPEPASAVLLLLGIGGLVARLSRMSGHRT